MPSLIRAASVAVAIATLAAATVLSGSAAAQTTEQKLAFPTAGVKDPDTGSVTLGVKFTAAKSGKVVAVEFHRTDTQNTARAVQLWSPAGALLGSAQTPNATTKGWNRAVFAAPIPVAAGQTFTASYLAPKGRYTARGGGFSSARTTGDLTAPIGAGVYRYGTAAAFPDQTFGSSDYYATPVFVADVAAPPTSTAPPPTSTTTAPPTSTTAPPPPPGGFPNPGSTGVPAGWVPTQTLTTALNITTPGTVVENVRMIGADINVFVDNVTIRNTEVQGGQIDNVPDNTCGNNMLLENVSIIRAPGQTTSGNEPVVDAGGYTARRLKIDGVPEGLRVGGTVYNCGPVVVEDSFIRNQAPDVCGDWHGDGLQGYGGPPVTVTNSTMEIVERADCGGTAPFFYPGGDAGNHNATINGLLVKGGGFPFRLGTPGTVAGLKVVDQSWGYGPKDVDCALVTAWEAKVVTIDANYQPTTVRDLPC